MVGPGLCPKFSDGMVIGRHRALARSSWGATPTTSVLGSVTPPHRLDDASRPAPRTRRASRSLYVQRF